MWSIYLHSFQSYRPEVWVGSMEFFAHGLTKTQIKVIAKPKGAIAWRVREEPYSRFIKVVAVSGDKGQCLVCLLFRILEFHPQKCTNGVWCYMPVILGWHSWRQEGHPLRVILPHTVNLRPTLDAWYWRNITCGRIVFSVVEGCPRSCHLRAWVIQVPVLPVLWYRATSSFKAGNGAFISPALNISDFPSVPTWRKAYFWRAHDYIRPTWISSLTADSHSTH